jgi:hypothetical protein
VGELVVDEVEEDGEGKGDNFSCMGDDSLQKVIPSASVSICNALSFFNWKKLSSRRLYIFF